MTIEKDFKDSPAFGYIPERESLYTGWNDAEEKIHLVYEVHYNEGVFVGYRWYEKKNVAPLYPFGHGLSYTEFEYRGLRISKGKFHQTDEVKVTCTVKNIGLRQGSETVQLYVQDVESSVPRPLKELKGFKKVALKPGESKTVSIKLSKADFSFWNPQTRGWFAEKGKFVVHVGSSSSDIRLKKEIELF